MTPLVGDGDPMTLLYVATVVGLALAGVFFTFVAMVGVLRLPDIYARAHTASQADTLGAGFVLAAIALLFGIGPNGYKAILLLFFIFLTNPTAAHAITRAAYEEELVPWTETEGGDDR